MITVITINYNNAAGLERTMYSVVSQTKFKELEYIIVDGNSTDGSKDILNSYIRKYPNISGTSEPDNGLYNAMNKGIDRSTGDYCIFMNSGDEFYSNAVIEEVTPFLTENVGVVAGIAQMGHLTWFPVSNANLNLSFFLKDSFNHQSLFVRRDILTKHHFSENYRIVCDHELLFKAVILDNERYKEIPVFICRCEKPGESGDIEKSLAERYDAIKKLLPARMAYDVDFIIEYHNPTILFIGRLLRNRFTKIISKFWYKFRIRK